MQDQTSAADAKANPTDETAKADKTADSTGETEKPKQEPKSDIDYAAKLKASQDEAIRLRKEYDGLQEQWNKVLPVLQTLQNNPDLMEQVDEAFVGKRKPTGEAQAQVIDALLSKKLQEQLTPLKEEMAVDRRQRVEKEFADFLKKHPDATTHWATIERNLTGMKVAGYPLAEGLENAYFLAKKEEAIKQGKKELAFELYQRDQAAAGGGSAASTGSSDESLSSEEKKVAEGLGLKTEDYAAQKSKKQ